MVEVPHELAVSEVSVTFGGVRALVNVSLFADKGTIVGLMGPNGAGKSTLIGVMSGFIRPTAGDIRIAGSRLTNQKPRRFAQAGVRRTFQRAAVIEDLTVRQHLLLGQLATNYDHRVWLDGLLPSRFRGAAERASAEIRAEDLMGRLGLSWCADRRPISLPPATQRIVELGMALMADPSVLLLDEPTAGLDRTETERIGDLLKEIAQNGSVAILLIEHDVALMMAVTDHVYVLDFGQVIAAGTPDEVRRHPEVQMAYLGGRG
jgi:ABC-type branched-subunit amino acid transport system ATPase component